jgi:hypothetical protein|tara:strand:+ start:56 stop:502 length:447 start_codon:yes stop_codon:yes gene_type:complete
MKKKTKTFQLKINEGDAIIRIRSDKTIGIFFGEDDETIIGDREWPEQEVYKTTVQFALMLDTFFRNGEGLDNLIMHSPTGSIASELLNEDMAIQLGFADSAFEPLDDKDEEELSDRLDEMQDELKDNNVVDATTRFTRITKKDDNETD